MGISGSNITWNTPAYGSWLPGQVVGGYIEIMQDGAGAPVSFSRIGWRIENELSVDMPSAPIVIGGDPFGINSPYKTAPDNSSTLLIPVSCTPIQSRVSTLATDDATIGTRVYNVIPIMYLVDGTVYDDDRGGNYQITVSFPGA